MKLLTIRKAAPVVGMPEFRLRQMQKEGALPGFFAGNRYYVDTDSLRTQLEAKCRQNKGEAKQ